MKLNSDKCFLLVSGHKHECTICTVGDSKIVETHCVKLLGVLIDSKLTFNDHLNLICKKAARKINALARQCAILPFHKRKLLVQAFFNSLFASSPLVWMFHSREINNKINKLHNRALRIIYRDEISTFEELLKKDGSLTIHHRNLHLLATEIYKVHKGIAPIFMSQIFLNNDNSHRETRFKPTFYCPGIPKTLKFGIETLRYLGPKIWTLVPDNIKSAASLAMFKKQIKKWKPLSCPYRLCATFISGLGYI